MPIQMTKQRRQHRFARIRCLRAILRCLSWLLTTAGNPRAESGLCKAGSVKPQGVSAGDMVKL